MATETIQAADHELLIGGERIETGEWSEVHSPYDGTVVGRVAKADAALVDGAISVAGDAFAAGHFPQHERAAVLERAAQLVADREDELAIAIAAEAGKPLKTARVEAQRCVGTLSYSAIEARTLAGEAVPMDGSASGAGKLGVAIRVPYGIVAAITPFNFPLNLVAHKLGPAIAAGNAVVIKPASDTPLSALKLTEVLLEAGLPPEGIQCLTGSGGEIGDPLVADRRVRKVTFTGSREVGDRICRTAGIKKVTMELGSNTPLIVMPDADLDKVAAVLAMTGYGIAGQTCIS